MTRGAGMAAPRAIALGAALAAALAAPAARAQDGAASVVLSPEAVDLGAATLGEPASGSFELRNAGDRPLRIARIASSCACLVAEAPAGDVAPGGSVRIPVTLTPGTKPGERVTKTLTLEIDGFAPRPLRVSAMVVARPAPWGKVTAVAGGIAAAALLLLAAARARRKSG